MANIWLAKRFCLSWLPVLSLSDASRTRFTSDWAVITPDQSSDKAPAELGLQVAAAIDFVRHYSLPRTPPDSNW